MDGHCLPGSLTAQTTWRASAGLSSSSSEDVNLSLGAPPPGSQLSLITSERTHTQHHLCGVGVRASACGIGGTRTFSPGYPVPWMEMVSVAQTATAQLPGAQATSWSVHRPLRLCSAQPAQPSMVSLSLASTGHSEPCIWGSPPAGGASFNKQVMQENLTAVKGGRSPAALEKTHLPPGLGPGMTSPALRFRIWSSPLCEAIRRLCCPRVARGQPWDCEARPQIDPPIQNSRRVWLQGQRLALGSAASLGCELGPQVPESEATSQ